MLYIQFVCKRINRLKMVLAEKQIFNHAENIR